MTLTCVVWRARLNTHWLRGRRGSGVGGCSRCRYCCCGQSQFLLLGLAGLQDIPLFHLLVKQLIVFLNIVLQVWGQFVHATEYLSRFLIKLLCTENRQIIIMCSLFVKNTHKNTSLRCVEDSKLSFRGSFPLQNKSKEVNYWCDIKKLFIRRW